MNMDGESMEANEIVLRKFGPVVEETRIDVSSLSDDFSGHGGGDIKMVEEFLDVLSGEKEVSPYVTSLEVSMESHYCALAAEESRVLGGQVVQLENYRNE